MSVLRTGVHGVDCHGVIPITFMGTGALGGYYQKVLSYGPLVYFPQWEVAGVVSNELVNGWDGAYTGVTLGQPGIGDGYTCPWFDGANDFNNILAAAFAAAFNGQEGTAALWIRVNDVGVWTDAAFRTYFRLRLNAANDIILGRTNVNNQLRFDYTAGGVADQVLYLGAAGITDWLHIAMTWSLSTPPTGELRAFRDGAQVGVTQVGLGIWAAGALTRALLGAASVAPLQVWHGWLAHGAVWTRALAPAEIADLAVV